MSDEHPSGLSEAEIWHGYTRYPYLLAKVALFGLLIFALYVFR